MYKLIIGNVRITVLEDNIGREQAAEAARKALNTATQEGKMLSHIEISFDETGLIVNTTEKAGVRTTRKTIKQSILDGMHTAIKEKLYPSNTFTGKDVWYDSDTGQEWRGEDVNIARDNMMEKFEEWMKTI